MEIPLFSGFLKLRKGNKKQFLQPLSNLLGFTPGNVALYEQAFRHNSVAGNLHISNPDKGSNERLEFLGDAILDCVIAETLFNRFPTKGEGFLTEMRSKMVSRERLSEVAKKMGLDSFLQYDKSIRDNKMVIRSIAGNALEALIGAIYLDKGYNFTRNYINRNLIKNHIDIAELASTETNYKSRLIEWSQKNKKRIAFEHVAEKQSGNFRSYVVKVLVEDEVKGEGEDFSKKKAEQLAAQRACENLKMN